MTELQKKHKEAIDKLSVHSSLSEYKKETLLACENITLEFAEERAIGFLQWFRGLPNHGEKELYQEYLKSLSK